jgi:hypothetical protein
MKPKDEIACATCGGKGRVWTTGAQHVEGWPVLVTWSDGRTAVESTIPTLPPPTCLACEDRRLGIPEQVRSVGADPYPVVDASAPPLERVDGDGGPPERFEQIVIESRGSAKAKKLTRQLGLGI